MMVVLLVVLKGGVGGVIPYQPTFTFDYVILFPFIGMLLEYRSCIYNEEKCG